MEFRSCLYSPYPSLECNGVKQNWLWIPGVSEAPPPFCLPNTITPTAPVRAFGLDFSTLVANVAASLRFFFPPLLEGRQTIQQSSHSELMWMRSRYRNAFLKSRWIISFSSLCSLSRYWSGYPKRSRKRFLILSWTWTSESPDHSFSCACVLRAQVYLLWGLSELYGGGVVRGGVETPLCRSDSIF